MKKFVFIYKGGGKPDNMTMEQVMDDWTSWFGKIGDKLVDGGNPFDVTGKDVKDSGVSNINGTPASGYSIVNAESLDAAVEVAKGCPMHKHNPGQASVEVYEAMPM